MQFLKAFFKLVRWPNLLFIVLTQFLFRYFIIPFAYVESDSFGFKLTDPVFFLLVLSSVFIAAAGYIINDYFDLNIDLVNKPTSLIVGKFIGRRWAIVLHIVFSAVGLILSTYVGLKIGNLYIPFFNLVVILALWIYSATLKKKLLFGNVLISLLTAWVIFVLTVSEYRADAVSTESWKRLLKFSIIYGSFAFIISLIREIIKDMEDIRGDQKYNSRTMPIVWGIPVSKMFVAVWIVVLASSVFILAVYMIQLRWWVSVIYSLFAVVLPLVWLIRKLYAARSAGDYHNLSSAVKLIMLSGMLSMIFFSQSL